ncbi:MAG: GTPase ObgE [Chloroflexi bacterium]|nr:GTPase ObgE [Chloroflexota bacterium]MDA1297077.1 GTPase ObgE [Chloroflexota bacterium]
MIDSARITVLAGNGGNGIVNFRREAFVPRGGPAGGDGGDGGSVVFVASTSVNTLLKFRKGTVLHAGDGQPGGSARKTGASADDMVVEVPIGTEVWDVTGGGNGILIGDLSDEGSRLVVARGGQGGFGNTKFASSTNQTPMLAEAGELGEEREVRLNLKLLADVGLIGMPNAGKSSILASISAAKPKIASYPFTTLEPSLGVVYFELDAFVVVDIPGLIEGAHSGVGLGHEFLKHIERTRVLAHVVDGAEPEVVERVRTINEELRLYNARLASTPQLIVVNKIDLFEDAGQREWLDDELHAAFGDGITVLFISTATRDGMDWLIAEMRRMLEQLPRRGSEGSETVAAANGTGPVLRPQPMGRKRSVEVVDKDVFRIVHPRAVRLARGSNLDDWSVLVQFQRRLSELGVTKELEAAGVVNGSTVIVDDMEFDWN